MPVIKVIFTKDYLSLFSWLIRWTLPRSRFKLALSSHCYIDVGDGFLYNALPTTGVTKQTSIGTGDIVVNTLYYNVKSLELAVDFLEEQLNKKYDLAGALGLAFGESKQWHEDDSWYCYELAAGVIAASGGEQFNCLSRITETALFVCSDNI